MHAFKLCFFTQGAKIFVEIVWREKAFMFKENGDDKMGKCKFWRKCKLYDPNSLTCNKTDGLYYNSIDGYAGCYVEMEEEMKNENWSETTKSLKKTKK